MEAAHCGFTSDPFVQMVNFPVFLNTILTHPHQPLHSLGGVGWSQFASLPRTSLWDPCPCPARLVQIPARCCKFCLNSTWKRGNENLSVETKGDIWKMYSSEEMADRLTAGRSTEQPACLLLNRQRHKHQDKTTTPHYRSTLVRGPTAMRGPTEVLGNTKWDSELHGGIPGDNWLPSYSPKE